MSARRSIDTRTVAWLLAGLIVVAVGFFAGRALASEGDDATAYAYELDTPPYAAPASVTGVSTGGFSGFGATGIEGETVASGRVRSVAPDSITLETPGGTEVVRITGPGTLRRIEASSASALRPGASVVVRLSDEGAVSGVLVVSGE